MNTKTLLAVLLAALSFSLPAAAELRIATISAAELVTGSPQYKAAEESMRKEFEARARELESSGKELAAEVERFKRDADIMSTSDRAAREKKLNTQRIDLAYAERKLKEDMQLRNRELLQKMMASISEVIEAVAKEGKYDLVVQDPVYAVESIDITKTVLKRLEKKK